MNERIKQLAEQAHFYQADDNYFTAAQEEFARLIVQECASIIESQDVDPTFRHRMSWAMKEHFGVDL
jgi:hypothetical protein